MGIKHVCDFCNSELEESAGKQIGVQLSKTLVSSLLFMSDAKAGTVGTVATVVEGEYCSNECAYTHTRNKLAKELNVHLGDEK